jgi:hypothetical protein
MKSPQVGWTLYLKEALFSSKKEKAEAPGWRFIFQIMMALFPASMLVSLSFSGKRPETIHRSKDFL